MKTKVLFFVLASALLAMMFVSCEATTGDAGPPGSGVGDKGPVLGTDFKAFDVTYEVTAVASGAGKIPAVPSAIVELAATGLATITVTPGMTPTGSPPVYYNAQAFAKAVAIDVKAAFNTAILVPANVELINLSTKVTLGEAVAYATGTYDGGSGTKVMPNSGTTNLDIVIPLIPKSGYYNPTSVQAFVITTTGITATSYWATEVAIKKSAVNFSFSATSTDAATFSAVTVAAGTITGHTSTATAISITVPKTSGVIAPTALQTLILEKINAQLTGALDGLIATGGLVTVDKTITGRAIGTITIAAKSGYKLTNDAGAAATITFAPWIKPGSAATAFATLAPVTVSSTGNDASTIANSFKMFGEKGASNPTTIVIENGAITGKGLSASDEVFFRGGAGAAVITGANAKTAINSLFSANATTANLAVSSAQPGDIAADTATSVVLTITAADGDHALPLNASNKVITLYFRMATGDSVSS